MKRSLQLLLMLGILVQSNSASAVRVYSANVYSAYHSIDSSRITLIADVQVGSTPCWVYSLDIRDSANTTFMAVCYAGGSALTTCRTIDTFDLGIKKNGEIKVTAAFLSLAGSFQFNCSQSFIYQDTFEFLINPAVTDIHRDQKSKTLILSPNPATTSITLQLQQTPAPATAFQLFEITGRMVLQKPLTETTNRIELNGVSKGMYLYNVVTEGEKEGAGKLIIE